jgi:hypothetical protein
MDEFSRGAQTGMPSSKAELSPSVGVHTASQQTIPAQKISLSMCVGKDDRQQDSIAPVIDLAASFSIRYSP